MRSQPVKFYQSQYESGVELILSHGAVKHRLYIDYVIAIDEESVTIKYPLQVHRLNSLKSQYKEMLTLMEFAGLRSKKEITLHSSNLLYMMIEFDNFYNELQKENLADYKIDRKIDFLRRFRKLSIAERRSCKISITFKGIPFELENEPFLSERVMNKITGNIENYIKNIFPANWQDILAQHGTYSGVRSSSALRNKAVGVFANRLKDYLNANTKALLNEKFIDKPNSLTTAQGNFIYDLFILFDVYKPRNRATKNSFRKIDHSEAIQKLIQRSKQTK